MILEQIHASLAGRSVLRGVSLRVEAGETLALLGPSGCGKTTLLRVIAGLVEPDRGRVEIGGEELTQRAPHQRRVGFVFQDLTLYPHMTVRENLAFPLRGRVVGRERVGRRECQQRVERMAERAGISGLLGRYPEQLSGGERQRVAIGRALIADPQALLLDEPLSQLDPHLRLRLRDELNGWSRTLAAGTIYVTHDASEAMAMADRIAVMRDGQIEQVGTVEEVYREPCSEYVAALLDAPPLNVLTLERPSRQRVGFRPASVRVLDADGASSDMPGESGVRDVMSWVGQVSGRYRFHAWHCLRVVVGERVMLALVAPDSAWALGATVRLEVPTSELVVFSKAESGEETGNSHD